MEVPVRITALAMEALNKPEVMAELVADLAAENQVGDRRADCFQAVLWLCNNHPEPVFRYWDQWTTMLTGNNCFAIFNAIHIIAALAEFDGEGRIDRLLPELIPLLNHRTMMVAANTALCIGKILKARPYLDQGVTEKLLEIPEQMAVPDKQQMMIRYVIQAFFEYFPKSTRRPEMLKFAQIHRHSFEGKTRALAEELYLALVTAG